MANPDHNHECHVWSSDSDNGDNDDVDDAMPDDGHLQQKVPHLPLLRPDRVHLLLKSHLHTVAHL